MKKTFILALIMLTAVCSIRAQKAEVFAVNGKAIKGYDAVAFFTVSKPVMGQDSLSYTWKDVAWLFSTRENLEAFKANPEKFAPQYGGYCAFGAALGHKAPTETDTWSVSNDKLYFNYSKQVKEQWLKDKQTNIEKADQNWTTLKDKP
ncbi:MAG: YHS domain-containing (seleno)protein [Puia sp.]|nr:YHS domain-containing (seleno)protein [Puia sp.]